ncbi:hypothetical protein SLEP1_g43912 [Rubroshorea leprosula]|uniref:Malectin-like domain-containing protein n=1 Tax=Rubroshorea leprosula TaxID=152421 RepID=A0AAV5LEK0_9ROSI|nr:hypothetical protein SLEP1_g43912 [Rubroshorea leprosula]
MTAGKTLVFKPRAWAVFILAALMSGLCAGHDKHIEPRKVVTAIDRSGSISIDCGVNEDYKDDQSGIYYQSDSDFVTTGLNKLVSPQYTAGNPQLVQMLNTLRSFPEGKKNCYHLKPKQGRGHHYMFRVFFTYGNYDGLQKPPMFDLYLGVNYWSTVRLENGNWYWHYEIIQFLSTDTIDVCLVNNGSGIPIISGLELRLLNDSIYQTESKALKSQGRYDVVPDDDYSTARNPTAPAFLNLYAVIRWKIPFNSYLGNSNHLLKLSANMSCSFWYVREEKKGDELEESGKAAPSTCSPCLFIFSPLPQHQIWVPWQVPTCSASCSVPVKLMMMMKRKMRLLMIRMRMEVRGRWI